MLREFIPLTIAMLSTVLWIALLRRSIGDINIRQFSSEQIQMQNLFYTSTKANIERLLLETPEMAKPPLLSTYILKDEICKQLLNGHDKEHSKNSRISKYIIAVNGNSDEHLNASCDAIRQRAFYPVSPFSNAEKNFPIAFVRIVYKDFHLQELLFNLMYAPQNFYCYALDAKSTPLFHEQMSNLSKCFPNVLLTQQEYEVDSAGHNTSRSFLECLRVIRKLPSWKYAILLQNNDIPLKSNREMVQILNALNGSNDINVGHPNVDRVPNDAPWTFRELNLFNDRRQNDGRKLRVAKGSTSASLSYAFVEFVVDKLNLTILLDKFDRLSYGVDEMLFSSLNSEDALGAPGGFTRQCIDVYNNMITRYVVWKKSTKRCRSGQYRHDICIFGIADLPTISSSTALFANKMLPEYDYTAIGCWAHILYNRTYSSVKIKPEKLKYYANRLPKPFIVESDKIDKEISSSCDKIKQRGIYQENSRTEIEKNFPLIFIRVVYRAYHVQELLFNLMYAPQNLYCYALDRKSNILFHEHMKNLSKCFSNVFLTKIEYDVDSAGHNMTRSYPECLNTLWKKPDWKYAILLQNDDIPLKSNYEMVQILDVFNGSNVINAGRPFLHRLPKNANWSYAALRLYKNSTRNRPDIQLRIAKGSSSVTLSRSFVEFVMGNLNLTTLIEMFDSRPYGTDEMLFHSLHSDDSLNAPGGFTRKCIDKQSGFITRYVVWTWSNRPCRSRKYRHNVCIFGVADLNYLREVRELFANKMLSESDYGAIACWARYLSQRASSNSTIDLENYKQNQVVRFNNNKAMWRKNMSLFKC